MQVIIVTCTPSPLFLLEVGRKKGGRNSRTVRYRQLVLLVHVYVYHQSVHVRVGLLLHSLLAHAHTFACTLHVYMYVQLGVHNMR